MATDRRSEWLGSIAEEGYLWLFPMILMDVTRSITTNLPAGARPGFGPSNHFTHMRAFPPGDFKEVVRPNYDTLYSVVWFDLRDGPVIVTAPDTGGRYYMLPILDMWTDVFAVIGSRTTGTGAGNYALATPEWEGSLPPGVQRIDAPTPIGWIIGRTQTNGASDYEAVHIIQDGFQATPLSDWPGPARTAGAEVEVEVEVEVDPEVDMATAPVNQVFAMSGPEFFSYAAELLETHRPHLVDQPVIARMAAVGFEVGAPFDTSGSNAAVLDAIEAAPARAQARMQSIEHRLDPRVNGWGMPTSQMGVYGTNYLRRAVIAKIGLGANLPEDAIYPVLYSDDDGDAPDGSHQYVLHFDADQLPPVDAFWSVTMYDAEGFPVPNDLERYALGDRDPLAYNDDGSLDLYIQHADPGERRSSNWLPAPSGPLGVTLRLYGPRPEALDGRWVPPPLQRSHS